MNCETALELLPWLLNDTLAAAERQQVLEHLASCKGCRQALADTRTAAAIFDWHPPATELIAHAAGESAPPGLAEHLAACPHCAAEMELLRTGRLLLEGGGVALLRPAGSRSRGEGAGRAAGERTEDRATSRVWRRAALAAGLGGILALGGWLESARTNQSLAQRLAAARSGEASARAGNLEAAGGGTQPPARDGATAGASGAALAAGTTATTATESIGTAGTAARTTTTGTTATGAPAPADTMAAVPGAPAPADSQAAALRRDAAQTQAKLEALNRKNSALELRVAELGRIAAETAQRTAGLTPPVIESGAWTDEVSPSEQTQRGGAAPAVEAIPLSAGAATLLLKSRHGEAYSAYEIEIRDARDRRVGGAVAVERRRGGQDSFPEFDIVLRRGALAPGSYTLQLFGHAANGREMLDTYSIRVS